MSDEFPFTGASDETITAANDDDDLPLATEYAWDFENDRFIYDGDKKHVIVEGTKAVEVWVYKALKVERYQYAVYSWQYGIELKRFIGKVMGVQERLSELKRAITECLMVNPYIKSIDSIEFAQSGTKMTANIALTTIYGEVSVSV